MKYVPTFAQKTSKCIGKYTIYGAHGKWSFNRHRALWEADPFARRRGPWSLHRPRQIERAKLRQVVVWSIGTYWHRSKNGKWVIPSGYWTNSYGNLWYRWMPTEINDMMIYPSTMVILHSYVKWPRRVRNNLYSTSFVRGCHSFPGS